MIYIEILLIESIDWRYSMKQAFILYKRYLTSDGENFTVGGIQTYISNLSQLLIKQGYKVYIYQFSSKPFFKKINNVYVVGIDVSNKKKFKRKRKVLYIECKKKMKNDDLLIFACETMIVKNNAPKSIAIQHGVSWDLKKHQNFNSTFNRLYLFIKAIRAYILIKRINKVKNVVCVDHNFVNWYRSHVAYQDLKLRVIPNFTKLLEKEKLCFDRDNTNVKIIFARRFVKKRGTRLFASAIKPILNKYNNVFVTFAGEGPDRDWLIQQFRNYPQVNFIKYNHIDSLQIHSEYDIAVIPTIGSEGTSLSLLESMAAGCAVIATNVGGMTNIILDNFNGLLVDPNEIELREAIEKLIHDKNYRNKLSKNALLTVSEAFSSKLWEEKWEKFLKEIV